MAVTTLGVGRLNPGGGRTTSERAAAAPHRHVDLSLVLTTVALGAMGLLMVYSATRGPGSPEDPVDRSFLARQGAFFAIGAVVMVLMAVVDYRRWSRLAPLVYVATVGILGLVLSPLGDESKGTQAWFQFGTFQLQPSELGKVGLIIVLSAYVALRNGHLRFRHLVVALVIASLPMGLILLQPDLGTALVFVAITTGILLVGGARPRHILLVTVAGLAGVVAILNSDVLAEYQKDRLGAFLDPKADVQGETYNIDQSQIAIGAGGVGGQGLFEGPQTRSGQVPEQQTDFIFTVVGEELGFVGAATVLALFGFLLWRVWRIAHLSRDLFGTLLCVGVLSMFLFQLFQSVGMTTGIMPVTGIPLPLLSYGGSSTLATCAALGLIQSVHMHRFV
jgi:rod shape determining protein RodA